MQSHLLGQQHLPTTYLVEKLSLELQVQGGASTTKATHVCDGVALVVDVTFLLNLVDL